MLNLINLEFKKTKLGWYYKGAVIANLCILGMLCLIGADEKSLPQAKMSMADAESTLQLIGIFVRSVFIVFAGVLIAKLIIGEYKNRTITVMFTYPVSRKKLIAAKLLLTGG
ncbi:ABC transporter permease [Bacillus haynesii]|nr:ABC transporter permease [Bacillus haynesii]MEC1468217.1 ABC transporter permease [Bacillus haynesii]